MKWLTQWSVFVLGYTLVVHSEIPSPKNVTLHTLNTNYMLKWDWDKRADNLSDVTFTTQYLPMYKLKKPQRIRDWRLACRVTVEYVCDFSAVQLHYYGMWVLRVRAESGTLVSRWVQIEFCPDRDARLGPPSKVDVTPVDGSLQVSISDPLSYTNSSMRDLIPKLFFHTQYWKSPLRTEKAESLHHQSNMVILPKLESWTRYCIRVQSYETYYNKTSVFSPTYCMQTEGHTPSWQVFLIFLVSMVLCFLLVLALCCGFLMMLKVLKYTLYPAVPLPAHINQFFSDSPDMPHLLVSELGAEVCSDRFNVVVSESVVADDVWEIHTSPENSGLLPHEDDWHHSRHSSGDSGVYSTQEDSDAGRLSALHVVQEVKLETIGRRKCPREPVHKEARQEQEVCV